MKLNYFPQVNTHVGFQRVCSIQKCFAFFICRVRRSSEDSLLGEKKTEEPPSLTSVFKARFSQVTESGRRLSEAACAERQTNWRVWVIGGTRTRPESPGIAAVSPGMAAVISRHGLNCILAKFRTFFVNFFTKNSATF